VNSFECLKFQGEDCVKFVTNGKYQKEVLVDAKSWDNYLNHYNWTITTNGKGYFQVHTSKDKLSVRLYRMIIEQEFNELDYWGNTIDHLNNDPLDNRKKNLRIYNIKLNPTNILSKNKKDDMHLIFPQNKKNGITGYKIHTNIFDKVYYKNFRTIEEAKNYREKVIIPEVAKKVEEIKKKTRDIEFERGLRDKLIANEKDEVVNILKKYNLSI
jgi:hypothetical protein